LSTPLTLKAPVDKRRWRMRGGGAEETTTNEETTINDETAIDKETTNDKTTMDEDVEMMMMTMTTR
jgi:hypothetical protein